MAHRSNRPRERPLQTFITGLSVTAVFGVLYWLKIIPAASWIFLFPLLFAGVLPMIRGLGGLLAGRASLEPPAGTRAPELLVDPKAETERKILRVAQQEGGRVTAAIAALRTDLSLDKAEEVLQDLARRGHAVMQVTDDGRVEYSFPEFMPRDP
jgi:hypothetical protein